MNGWKWYNLIYNYYIPKERTPERSYSKLITGRKVEKPIRKMQRFIEKMVMQIYKDVYQGSIYYTHFWVSMTCNNWLDTDAVFL